MSLQAQWYELQDQLVAGGLPEPQASEIIAGAVLAASAEVAALVADTIAPYWPEEPPRDSPDKAQLVESLTLIATGQTMEEMIIERTRSLVNTVQEGSNDV